MTTLTLFAASIRLLGLSQTEAADFLSVRLDTVKAWCSGKNRVPPGVWMQLRELYDAQCTAVEAALDLVDEMQPDTIAPTVKGLRAASWPCDGAHMAVAAAIALSIDAAIDEEALTHFAK